MHAQLIFSILEINTIVKSSWIDGHFHRSMMIQSVDPSAACRGCLRRWRQELSVALQFGNFAIYSSCTSGCVGLAGCHAAPASLGNVADFICARC